MHHVCEPIYYGANAQALNIHEPQALCCVNDNNVNENVKSKHQ